MPVVCLVFSKFQQLFQRRCGLFVSKQFPLASISIPKQCSNACNGQLHWGVRCARFGASHCEPRIVGLHPCHCGDSDQRPFGRESAEGRPGWDCHMLWEVTKRSQQKLGHFLELADFRGMIFVRFCGHSRLCCKDNISACHQWERKERKDLQQTEVWTLKFLLPLVIPKDIGVDVLMPASKASSLSSETSARAVAPKWRARRQCMSSPFFWGPLELKDWQFSSASGVQGFQRWDPFTSDENHLTVTKSHSLKDGCLEGHYSGHPVCGGSSLLALWLGVGSRGFYSSLFQHWVGRLEG